MTAQLVPADCAPVRGSPEPAAPPAPRPTLAADAPAACSDISDQQLLAVTDTASLTADQLDRRHHLLRHRCAATEGQAASPAGRPPPLRLLACGRLARGVCSQGCRFST